MCFKNEHLMHEDGQPGSSLFMLRNHHGSGNITRFDLIGISGKLFYQVLPLIFKLSSNSVTPMIRVDMSNGMTSMLENEKL